MKERKSLCEFRRWWREDRPIFVHKQWGGVGWTGNGWNCFRLGFATVWFKSGMSPRHRVSLWVRRV